jgi:hypothetical protein
MADKGQKYQGKSLTELQKEARSRGIAVNDSMTEDQLVKELEGNDSSQQGQKQRETSNV